LVVFTIFVLQRTGSSKAEPPPFKRTYVGSTPTRCMFWPRAKTEQWSG
jgi:hypothetical protein